MFVEKQLSLQVENRKLNTTMKRLVFLFIASLMAHYSALAETILPFVQDGKVWVYDVSNFINNWEETFSLEGDTLIGTRNCLKLYYTCQVYGQEHVYRGAMFYKSNGNVCFIAPGSTTPVLMYDFASEPGTIINVGPFELKINEKKLAKYHGEYLKVIDYSPIEREGFEGQWIDGVGIISGGNLTQLVEGNATWATGGERQLKTCAVNGEVVFEWNDFYTSSQIVTGISMPSVSNRKNTLFDLQGRKLQDKPARGIYIEDGQKVLIK